MNHSPTPHALLVLLLGALLTFGCATRGAGGDGPDAAAASTRDSSSGGGANSATDASAADSEALFTPGAGCDHPPVERACRDGLCTIAAGCFVMGVPRGAATAARNSNIEVEVRLSHAFVIGQTEVTRSQWFAQGLPEPGVDWVTAYRTEAPDVAPPGQEPCLEADCPVTWINFEDAMAYANLRSEAEGLRPCYQLSDCVRSPGDHLRCRSVRVDAPSPYECEGYRLPTEAEWEYAARAGTRTDVYSGDLDPSIEHDAVDCSRLDRNLDRIAWYCGNSSEGAHVAGTGGPHAVAQKEPNGFGLHDTAGNVFEWANDRYTPAGYGSGPLTDPLFGIPDPSDLTPSTPVFGGMTDGNDPLDGFPGYRSLRGGTYDLFSQLCGLGKRHYGSFGGQHNGFRIARTLGDDAEEESSR